MYTSILLITSNYSSLPFQVSGGSLAGVYHVGLPSGAAGGSG